MSEATEELKADDGAAFAPRPPVFDVDRYLPMVDDFECTEEEKLEFLETLWSIMCGFVELGFGVDSISILFTDFLENAGISGENDVVSDDIPDTNNQQKTASILAEKVDSK